MLRRFLKNILGPLVPYITIGTGLFFFHSAWIAILSYHLAMLAVAWLSPEPISWKAFLQSTKSFSPLLTFLGGACGGLILYLLWPVAAINSGILQNTGLTHATLPYLAAYFIFINPWIEELYWRGFLTSRSRLPVLNDFFFAGYHLLALAGKIHISWLPAVLAVLVLAAWAWRQFNRLDGGLWPSLASHLAADATIILAILSRTA